MTKIPLDELEAPCVTTPSAFAFSQSLFPGVLIPAGAEQEVAAQVDVAVHGLLSRGRREEKEKDILQITPWAFL